MISTWERARPSLTTRLRELHDQREEALAHVLASDTASAPGDITPKAAAAHRTLFGHVMDLTVAGKSSQEIATAVTRAAHQAFDLLEPSLADYAVRPDRS